MKIPIVPEVGGFNPSDPLKFKPVPSASRLLDKVIYTEKLILPEFGGCGGCYYNQLLWLKEKIKSYYSLSNENFDMKDIFDR